MSIRSVISTILPSGGVQRVVLALAIATAGVQTIRLSDAQADVAEADARVEAMKASNEAEKSRLWNEYVQALEQTRKSSNDASQAAIDAEAQRMLELVRQKALNEGLKEKHGAKPLTDLQRDHLARYRSVR